MIVLLEASYFATYWPKLLEVWLALTKMKMYVVNYPSEKIWQSRDRIPTPPPRLVRTTGTRTQNFG